MTELMIVVIYFMAVIAIGIVSRRRRWGLDDFFVSGRRCSALFVTGSLLATMIGGSATIGMAGLGFTQGLTGAWWLLVGTIGLLFLGFFFARKVREYGLYTLPALLGKQYDRRISLASSILIVIAWLGVIAGQIIAAGKILSALGIGSATLWMVLFSATFIGYVIIGGQDAVIRTDLLQIVIIGLGIFAGAGLLLWHTGGLTALQASLPADRFAFPFSSKFGPMEFATYLFLVGSTYAVGPDMYSRLFCARDARTAKVSVFWAAVVLIPFALAITIIGVGASSLFPTIQAEQAFPTVARQVFPPLVGGLVIAALISAIMSSADTTLMSASTILTTDIVKHFKPDLSDKRTITISRWSILVLGIFSLLLALVLKGVISALMFAYTIYTCGVILPVIVGFYRNRLKVTATAALAAVIGGGAAGLASKLLGIKYLDLGGLAIAAILLVVVSIIENRRRKLQ